MMPLRKSPAAAPVRHDAPPMTDHDVYLFNEGTHFDLWKHLGAHPVRVQGENGVRFAVWAPNAERVSVLGDFDQWSPHQHPLRPLANSGIWHGFVPGLATGAVYKYHVEGRHRGHRIDKADPFGFHHEVPPNTASIVTDLAYEWSDAAWMSRRKAAQALDAPMSVYEVHLGSWRHVPDEDDRSLTYREAAKELAEYAGWLGHTHVQFLPLMEHPFAGSWGYQTTGYFAPTSRFGSPQDFMHLVDTLHRAGLGVILDWVPSHFPSDGHGLAYFDGTHLYEHSDPRRGFHPDWKSLIFNYGRHEVRSFLISSAMFWLGMYHIDALRVDAVASMLYLDYSRKAGEWVPNEFGGRENLEAIQFLRRLNEEAYRRHPDVQVIAEESTAWPMVSRPTHLGGLGFGLKWDMGWMHDTLKYFGHDPIHRRFHHHALTFRMVYAFHENFMLPLSHDEVVHGKSSLLGKMPGDDGQKFANLRLLLAYQWAQPAKKLLFMGGEFGQWAEWNHDKSLDWHLTAFPPHAGLQRLVRHLNRAYRDHPALHALDCEPAGFEWIDASDADHSVLTFLRKGRKEDELVIAAFNLTPVPRPNYLIGSPRAGAWRVLVNTDDLRYGGSGAPLPTRVPTEELSCHGRPHRIRLDLPPLGAVLLAYEGGSQ